MSMIVRCEWCGGSGKEPFFDSINRRIFKTFECKMCKGAGAYPMPDWYLTWDERAEIKKQKAVSLPDYCI